MSELSLDLGRIYGDSAFEEWCKRQDPVLDSTLTASWLAFLEAIKGEPGPKGEPGADGLTEAEVDARVAAGITGKQDVLSWDDAPVEGSTNPVTSGGVFTALSGKQDALTFDATPTDSSSNPVTSGGVHAAIAAASIGDTGWLELTKNAEVVTAGGIYYRVKNGTLYIAGNFTYSNMATGLYLTTAGIPEASLPPTVYGTSVVQLNCTNGPWYRGNVVLERSTGKLKTAGGVANYLVPSALANGTSITMILANNSFVLT